MRPSTNFAQVVTSSNDPPKSSDIIAAHSVISAAERNLWTRMLNSYKRLSILFHGGRKRNQSLGLCSVRALNFVLLRVVSRLHSFCQWLRQESDFQPVIKYGWWIEGLALLKGPDVRAASEDASSNLTKLEEEISWSRCFKTKTARAPEERLENVVGIKISHVHAVII